MIQNLLKTLTPTSIHESSISTILRIAVGVGIMTLCAKMYIPLNPVPITLQTVGMLFIGLYFPLGEGLAAMLTYILLGMTGLPVFAGAATGLSVLTGATGGYILGFVTCLLCMNALKPLLPIGQFRNKVIVTISGSAVQMICGVLWLSAFIGSMHGAIQMGFLPFIIPGALKVVLLTGMCQLMEGQRRS